MWGTGDEQLSIKDGGRLAESVAVAMDKRQIPAVAETGIGCRGQGREQVRTCMVGGAPGREGNDGGGGRTLENQEEMSRKQVGT